MKRRLKNYFSFSKKEFNGILLLYFLIVIITMFPYLYRYYYPVKKFDLEPFKKEVREFTASAKDISPSYYSRLESEIEAGNLLEAELFFFDPNGLPASDWKRLGLTDRQIRVIKNYESKGGKFYSKKDVEKMYSISASQYKRLEPFIRIKENRGRPFKSSSTSGNAYHIRDKVKPGELFVVELNSADSARLVSVKGIGPVFANRIIKFRNRLGGFYSKEQLREVYGMDSIKYESLSKFIRVDPLAVKKVNVNQAVFEDLKRQPYLNFKQINAIISYRKQHGPYRNLDDLKKIAIIDDGILRKIAPYLVFE